MPSASANDRDEQAAEWAIRLENGDLSYEDDHALAAWLADSERNQGALLRAEAALSLLNRGRAFTDNVERQSSVQLSFKRAMRSKALAFGSIVTIAASVLLFAIVVPRPTVLATQVGEIRRVPLNDGSIVTLNTGSEVKVAMKPSQRTLQLENGEAWFSVAHDKKRPFLVEAGDIRVKAVGTAFSVRRRPGGADVFVTEGVVEIWHVGPDGRRLRLPAGSRAFFSSTDEPDEVHAVTDEIERRLAWRRGEIILSGESLGYAITEFNRYNTSKLVVESRALAEEPLVGSFNIDQPEQFASSAARLFGASVERRNQEIVIKAK